MLTKIDENTTAWGQLAITKIDGVTGETTTQVVPNIITTLGKIYIAQRMAGAIGTEGSPGYTATAKAMKCMALGTGTVATNVADAWLGGYTVTPISANTEIPVHEYVGGAVRPYMSAPTGSANVLTYVCTFGPQTGAVTKSITEAGIFDSNVRSDTGPVGGNMLCRTVFGVVTKTALDTITITWTVTIN